MRHQISIALLFMVISTRAAVAAECSPTISSVPELPSVASVEITSDIVLAIQSSPAASSIQTGAKLQLTAFHCPVCGTMTVAVAGLGSSAGAV